MLFQPTYVRPSAQWGLGNGTVDATNDLDVKWQVNGNSPMTAYQITIYDNDAVSTQKYTTGKITNNCPFYPVKYDGSTELFSHTIDVATLLSSGITNGNEYKFIITQWWSVSESIAQTSASVFYTREAPTVTITAIPSPLVYKTYSFTATYSQAQDDALNWARWEIKDADDNIIFDTHNIYGASQLQCDYDGFFTEQSYAIRLTIQTERGVEATSGWVQFDVEYPTNEYISGLEVSCEKDKSCVALSWAAAAYIPATVVGTGSIDSSHGYHYEMTTGDSLTWNTVSGSPMSFGIPWAIALQGKVNSNGGDIFNISIGATTTLTLRYDATIYTLILEVDENGTVTTISEWQIEPSEITFALSPTKAYIKANCREFGLTPSETILISPYLYPQDWITRTDAYYENDITYTQGDILSVEVADGLEEISYIWVMQANALADKLSAIIGSDLTQYDYKPSYDGFTYMLALFTLATGTDAGSISAGSTITGFTLYRRDGTKSTLKRIADFSSDKSIVRDYGIPSQLEAHTYYLFPKSASTYTSPPVVSEPVNPVFWSWTLLDCVENSNGEYVVQREFNFKNNISTSSVSNNNEPNVIKNFTQYPTVQPSPHNYQSGTLTSLIGGIEYSPIYGSYRYVDTIELRNAIYNLSTKNDILFLKNRKGDVMQIGISEATEMSTNDNSKEQIQTMTLHWVEIGSTETKTIISF